ncbi:pinin-like protein [Parasponia andersonii]|uniref:Pinin-like protein n=1 Tax=Parasponia andersonii TaxID=3476 RepID=A0A2P5BBK9_PARAD|nr:pinin-like protein [Parasponia andersonii]
MDVLANEHGRESSKSLKVPFDFDVPKISTQDEVNSSGHNSSSSSASYSPPESVVTEKDVEFSLQPKQVGPYCGDSHFSPDLNPQLPMWSPHKLSPMQSPLVQAPARPSGYDPNRIPASIFSSKPSTPLEWSTASNESLFSIHVGNTSFSKDQFLALYRSGELTKFEEFVTNVPPPFPAGANESSSRHSCEIKAVNFERESSESASTNNSKESSGLEFHGREKNTNMKPGTFDNQIRRKGRNNSNSHLSYRSDESYNSTRSFQFPVLVGHDHGAKFSTQKVDSKRHWLLPQPQPLPLMHILKQHERSQVFVRTKPKSAISRWMSCFSFCYGKCH